MLDYDFFERSPLLKTLLVGIITVFAFAVVIFCTFIRPDIGAAIINGLFDLFLAIVYLIRDFIVWFVESFIWLFS